MFTSLICILVLAFQCDNFYLQPISGAEAKLSTEPWFSVIPVGRNTLQKMVKDMCTECGIKGNKTNHSLRATGSVMFNAGIPEKIIQKHTAGHLSLIHH